METALNTLQNTEQKRATRHVFEQFLSDYQAVLTKVEDYLEEIIEKTDNNYKEAYIPWRDSLHELLSGACFIAKEIPLPNREGFVDALRMFSFESTITFLRDICSICQLRLKSGWRKEFQKHINQLISEFSVVNRQYCHTHSYHYHI